MVRKETMRTAAIEGSRCQPEVVVYDAISVPNGNPMTYERIVEVEADLARDRSELEHALKMREDLLADGTRCGFRNAAIGISLRFDIQGLTQRIAKNRYRLINAKK
jgi:hypothetical protein